MTKSEIYRQMADLYMRIAHMEDVGVVSMPPASNPVTGDVSVPRRIGRWVGPLNLGVKGLAERPDRPQPGTDGVVYVIKDIFTTLAGNWDLGDHLGCVDAWARDAYLPFDGAGGNQHLFGAVVGLDGAVMPDTLFQYWSDGFLNLGNSSYHNFTWIRAKSNGWANLPIFGPGSSFVPERGETGPWCWAPNLPAEVMCGGGLPANQHVSTFAVWQAVKV